LTFFFCSAYVGIGGSGDTDNQPSWRLTQGYIADFAIFNRALSDQEVKSIVDSKDGLQGHTPKPTPQPTPKPTPQPTLPKLVPTAPAPTPPLTIEEKYSLSLVGNSTEVAFKDDSKTEEVKFKLKVADASLTELRPITFLDYNTCGTEFDDSLNLISATYDKANKVANESDERYWDLPILVDVNTKQFSTALLPNGYFTKLDGNQVQLKFCVKSELGKSDIIKLDGGQTEESSISYTKVKFDITINMETGFTTNLIIEEKSASTASDSVLIAYKCKLSQCDGFCLCSSCMIVVR
jgi:hypothetical protein